MIFRRHIRRTSKKISIKLLFAVVIFIGIGYAYVNSSLNIVGSTSILKSNWDVHFENLTTINGTLNDDESITLSDDKKSINFNVNLETIDDFYQIDVDIVNKGDIDAMLNEINFSELTDSQKEYLEFYATYNNGNTININDGLKAGEFDVITVTLKYKDGIDLAAISEETDYLDLTLTMNYGQATKKAVDRGTNLISIMSKNSISDNSIDFSQISSETNGQGVYFIESTKTSTNPIYYYRGAVTNNNLKFGGFCWKIVRTTDTGGIKILYNGEQNSNGICNETGESTTIGKSKYNENSDDNTYLGYMYGNANSSSYDETHANVYDSILKKKIEDWYENKLISKTTYLEDTIWCNDRDNVKAGSINNSWPSVGQRNLYSEIIPTISCKSSNDRFTVSIKNGNGKLNYPVATINADELTYAGENYNLSDESNYLNSNISFWTMSPAIYEKENEFKAQVILKLTGTAGINQTSVKYESAYIRPMVSLKRGTRFSKGDGTKESPYVVN